MTSEHDFPLPDPAFEPLQPFWHGAAHGELRLPRCRACGAFDWYPSGSCEACGGTDIGWQALSGDGHLFSWAVVRRPLHPPLAGLGTYISAIVALAEDPQTRLVTRLVDCEPDGLNIDMPVHAVFRDLGYPDLETGVTAPLFATEKG